MAGESIPKPVNERQEYKKQRHKGEEHLPHKGRFLSFLPLAEDSKLHVDIEVDSAEKGVAVGTEEVQKGCVAGTADAVVPVRTVAADADSVVADSVADDVAVNSHLLRHAIRSPAVLSDPGKEDNSAAAYGFGLSAGSVDPLPSVEAWHGGFCVDLS